MIIADTGFWLALANRRDRWHSRALDAYEQLDDSLITTWPVLTETCHLLLHRLGTFALLAFTKSLKDGALEVYNLSDEDRSELHLLMRKYRELPMDLADASLVILANHLGHGQILSTDERDFKTYRWKERKPFRNLLQSDR